MYIQGSQMLKFKSSLLRQKVFCPGSRLHLDALD